MRNYCRELARSMQSEGLIVAVQSRIVRRHAEESQEWLDFGRIGNQHDFAVGHLKNDEDSLAGIEDIGSCIFFTPCCPCGIGLHEVGLAEECVQLGSGRVQRCESPQRQREGQGEFFYHG